MKFGRTFADSRTIVDDHSDNIIFVMIAVSAVVEFSRSHDSEIRPVVERAKLVNLGGTQVPMLSYLW